MNRTLYFKLNWTKLFYEYFNVVHVLNLNTFVNKLLSSTRGKKFNK
jgi:hypothetical protein